MQMKNRMSFWDWLAWVAFAIFFSYLLLKTLGILESPPVADILAIASAAYFIGKYAQRIDTIEYKLEDHIKNRGIHK